MGLAQGRNPRLPTVSGWPQVTDGASAFQTHVRVQARGPILHAGRHGLLAEARASSQAWQNGITLSGMAEGLGRKSGYRHEGRQRSVLRSAEAAHDRLMAPSL